MGTDDKTNTKAYATHEAREKEVMGAGYAIHEQAERENKQFDADHSPASTNFKQDHRRYGGSTPHRFGGTQDCGKLRVSGKPGAHRIGCKK